MKKLIISTALILSFVSLTGCGCSNFVCTPACSCEYSATCCGSNGWY